MLVHVPKHISSELAPKDQEKVYLIAKHTPHNELTRQSLIGEQILGTGKVYYTQKQELSHEYFVISIPCNFKKPRLLLKFSCELDEPLCLGVETK